MPLNNPATGVEINSGSYSGSDAADRAIAHGLTKTPGVILLTDSGSGRWFRLYTGRAFIDMMSAAASAQHAVTAPDSTNFYVGNAANYSESANAVGETYTWVAIG